MEGNGGQHHLQRVAKALDAAGASYECASCGKTEWDRNPDPVVLKETRAVEVGETGVPVAGELVGGIPAYALICRNCGFMRLHSVSALLGEYRRLPLNGEDSPWADAHDVSPRELRQGGPGMVTLRHEPGSIAPLRGTYVLVDHFNGSSGVAQWYEQGAKFPPAVIDGGTGPFWYIRVDESTADALAA